MLIFQEVVSPLVKFMMSHYKISLAQLPPDWKEKVEAGDISRAGASCICTMCGLEYIHHPHLVEPYADLVVICGKEQPLGEIYKL